MTQSSRKSRTDTRLDRPAGSSAEAMATGAATGAMLLGVLDPSKLMAAEDSADWVGAVPEANFGTERGEAGVEQPEETGEDGRSERQAAADDPVHRAEPDHANLNPSENEVRGAETAPVAAPEVAGRSIETANAETATPDNRPAPEDAHAEAKMASTSSATSSDMETLDAQAMSDQMVQMSSAISDTAVSSVFTDVDAMLQDTTAILDGQIEAMTSELFEDSLQLTGQLDEVMAGATDLTDIATDIPQTVLDPVEQLSFETIELAPVSVEALSEPLADLTSAIPATTGATFTDQTSTETIPASVLGAVGASGPTEFLSSTFYADGQSDEAVTTNDAIDVDAPDVLADVSGVLADVPMIGVSYFDSAQAEYDGSGQHFGGVFG